MTLEEMTRDERSLLLFFESACVERGGTFHPKHMNADDFDIFERWKKIGFLDGGRLTMASIERLPSKNSMWVSLSDLAWILAQKERRARHQRIFSSRTWKTTEEKRNEERDELQRSMEAYQTEARTEQETR